MSQATFTVTLNGIVDLNGLPKEALEDHLRQSMITAIGNGFITGHTEAEVDEYDFSVLVEGSVLVGPAVADAPTDSDGKKAMPALANRSCHKCEADLTQPNSVTREYVDKTDDAGWGSLNSVFSEGHYDADGCFEMDIFEGFGGESNKYDLRDDSDHCTTCNALV